MRVDRRIRFEYVVYRPGNSLFRKGKVADCMRGKRANKACARLFTESSNLENLVPPSLSNTVEQIRPVNGLTRLVRLVRSVQVMKEWFTSRTGRGTMVTCISLVRQHFDLDSTTRKTRTGRTGRETMVYESYSW